MLVALMFFNHQKGSTVLVTEKKCQNNQQNDDIFNKYDMSKTPF